MAKYAPGSFTKNFAWHAHGRGLQRLHTVIRRGFDNTLAPVPRSLFRGRCGVDEESLQLIPVNFFLHNSIGGLPRPLAASHTGRPRNFVSVDELVRIAIDRPHSQLFDRVSLYALHLNMAGNRLGTNGVAEPAMWIKSFVETQLWKDGAWRPRALARGEMDAYFPTVLDAQPDALTKCVTNYRYLLELCNYLDYAPDAVNSGAEQWLVPALFLTWDRLFLDGFLLPGATKADLVGRIQALQLHKIAGTTDEFVIECAKGVVDGYVDSGGLGRFGAHQQAAPPATPTAAEPKGKPANVPDEPPSSADLDLDYSIAEQVKRRLIAIQAQIRNPAHVRKLKKLYGNVCQFCGAPLQVETSPDLFYAEGAHIKPLGKPHNGPDTPANLLILCPNHHVELDAGMLWMTKGGEGFKVHARVVGHPLHGKIVRVLEPHQLDPEFVTWHRSYFSGRRK